MRNLIVMALCGVLTVVASSELTLAGGGGKGRSRSRISFTNTEAVGSGAIAVFVRTEGTGLPATVGALRRNLIFVGPGETRRTASLRTGRYEITTIDVADLAGVPDGTPLAMVDLSLALGNETVPLGSTDLAFEIDASGIFPIF